MIQHTKSNRCPICNGANTDPKGKGVRCWGFTSDDGKYVRCTREQMAGALQLDGTFFVHFMEGICKCGLTHGQSNGTSRHLLSTYEYRDEQNKPLYRVLRYIPKSFSQERWDEKSNSYVGGEGAMSGVRRVPYRLPELLSSTGPVLILEGEKDVDTAYWLGFVATCNVGGAGNWQTSLNGQFKDRDVIILPDQDEKGLKHKEQVERQLKGHAKSVKSVNLPEKDLTLWVERGGTADELKKLIEQPLDYHALTGSKPQLISEYLPSVEDSVDYILEPVAIAGGLTQLHGEPKSGKSCLSLYLALVAATGADVPGEFITCDKPVPVLYLAFEDGPRRLKKRILDYMAGLQFGHSYPDDFRVWIKPDLDVGDPSGQQILTQAILDSRARLVVLDTISHLHKAEENSSKEMKVVMASLAKIARDTNAAILYVHHSNKATGDGAKSAIYKGRGSSAIVAAADVVLDWGRPENNVTKCELISKDDDGQKWLFHYQTTSDGISWKMSTQEKNNTPPTDFKILQALQELYLTNPAGIVASQLATHTGLSKKWCGLALDRLAKKGDAVYSEGKNHSKLYRPSGV